MKLDLNLLREAAHDCLGRQEFRAAQAACMRFDDLISPLVVINLIDSMARYQTALAKIADPRLRDHKEPDDYTEKCCLMHIAAEALNDHSR